MRLERNVHTFVPGGTNIHCVWSFRSRERKTTTHSESAWERNVHNPMSPQITREACPNYSISKCLPRSVAYLCHE